MTYPQKDPRTEHGRKLGPADHMAPEMRENADTAAGQLMRGPLAKTSGCC